LTCTHVLSSNILGFHCGYYRNPSGFQRKPRPSCLLNPIETGRWGSACVAVAYINMIKNQPETIGHVASYLVLLHTVIFLASVPLLPQQENNQMCQPRCIEHITEVQSDRFHPYFNFTGLQRGSLAPQCKAVEGMKSYALTGLSGNESSDFETSNLKIDQTQLHHLHDLLEPFPSKRDLQNISKLGTQPEWPT